MPYREVSFSRALWRRTLGRALSIFRHDVPCKYTEHQCFQVCVFRGLNRENLGGVKDFFFSMASVGHYTSSRDGDCALDSPNLCLTAWDH